MSQEFQQFLWLIGISGGVGLIIGLFLRWQFGPACKQYAVACKNLSWVWYGLFGLMFVLLALISLGNIYYVATFTAFAVLEFGMMGYRLMSSRNSLPSGG